MKKKEKLSSEEKAEMKREKKSWNWMIRIAKKKGALIPLIIVLISLASCSKWCEPQNIESGKSLQHHDWRQFRATYSRKGNFWIVTYKNMNEERKNIVSCKPPFRSGAWILKND